MLPLAAEALIGQRHQGRNCRGIGRIAGLRSAFWTPATHAKRASMSQQKVNLSGWTSPETVNPALQRLAL
jgi:hypothetical protein